LQNFTERVESVNFLISLIRENLFEKIYEYKKWRKWMKNRKFDFTTLCKSVSIDYWRNQYAVVLNVILIALFLLAAFQQAAYGALPSLVINEIDYDQPSTDTAEFIEIKNKSGFAANLGEYNINLINGSGGGAQVYKQIVLPIISLGAGDYFVICANPVNTPNCDLNVSPDTNLIQNGSPDAVTLMWFDTLTVDKVSYEGNTSSHTEGSGVGLEDSPSLASAGISRYPDGVDTQMNNVDLGLSCITPGQANTSSALNTYYTDNDGDGFGDINDTTGVNSCVQPNGYAANRADCDDGNGSIYPGVLNTFTDVPQSHWGVTYIEALSCSGITTGCTASTYCPGSTVTRAQMAAFIIRAFYGETFTFSAIPYFSDVPDTHWAFNYIQKMFEDGITTGCGGSNYCPGNNVTRAQMAAFMMRALYGDSFSYTTSPYFSDVSSGHWAFQFIQKMKDDGVTTGCTANRYCPGNSVTRAQMAAFIARAFLGLL
jgi:hypothetical protein